MFYEKGWKRKAQFVSNIGALSKIGIGFDSNAKQDYFLTFPTYVVRKVTE